MAAANIVPGVVRSRRRLPYYTVALRTWDTTDPVPPPRTIGARPTTTSTTRTATRPVTTGGHFDSMKVSDEAQASMNTFHDDERGTSKHQ